MGNTHDKDAERKSNSTPNAEARGSRDASGDFMESPHGKTNMRNRSSTTIKLGIGKLVKQINSRRPKSVNMRAQRFRDEFGGKALPSAFSESSNPRFRKSHKLSRNFSRKMKHSSTKTDVSKLKVVNIPEGDKNDLLSDDGKSRLFKPKPPANKKVRPRFAVKANVEEIPFESFNDKTDYRSYQFSALSLSMDELKESAIEMLLCSINVDVILGDKLNLDQVREKVRLNSNRFTGINISSMMSRGPFKSLRSRSNTQSNTLRDRIRAKSGCYATAYPLTPTAAVTDEVRKAVEEFVEEVANGYTETTYHSFAHAVDVTQMMFMLGYFLRSSIKGVHTFTLLVACLCHDIGHFGANNFFLNQISKRYKQVSKDSFKSSLRPEHSDANVKFGKANDDDVSALTRATAVAIDTKEHCFFDKYEGISKLEQFHVEKFLKIATTSRLFSEEFMLPATRTFILDTCKELILATDMERHDSAIEAAEATLVDDRESLSPGKTLLPMPWLVMAIKLCDVANVSRDFNDAQRWSILLSREFQATGTIFENVERHRKIFEKNMDKLSTNVFELSHELTTKCLIDYQKECVAHYADCAQITANFIVQKALPMALLLSEIQPQASWFLIDRMHLNLQCWSIAINKEDEKNKK